jgi:urocanate hydratase
MLFWDVNNGVARRAWAGNSNANLAIREAMEANKGLFVTVATPMSTSLQEKLAASINPISKQKQ